MLCRKKVSRINPTNYDILMAEVLYMKFIGRENETKALESLISKKGYRGAIIYGRRRLGKTELLKHCLLNKGIPVVFFQCSQSNERDNTDALTSQIMAALGLSHLYFKTFIEAVGFVFEESKKRQIYFVIDEYPYVRELVSGLDSKLQFIIDHETDGSDLKFFLSGSSIQTMEAILNKGNALYQRFHLSLLLKEMDYYDSSLFYPTFSSTDKVTLYSAFGGSPFYNAQIDPSLSAEENILSLLCGNFAHLMDEANINLKSELSKINNANVVFLSIAEGAFHYSDILSQSHITSSPVLADVLGKLVKMDLIENIVPINEKKNRTKAGYRISDNALRFYYRYLYKNASALSLLNEEAFFDVFIRDDFYSRFVPQAFEVISKQFLVRQNKAGKLNPLLTDIGTYWYDDAITRKNGQFDVVGKSQKGYVFYEAQYTSKKIDDGMIAQEVRQVQETSLDAVQYGFISKSGFSIKKDYPYQLFVLDDLYK